jgi:pilus assembly protein CpaC
MSISETLGKQLNILRILIVLLVTFIPVKSWAAPSTILKNEENKKLDLVIGKTTYIEAKSQDGREARDAELGNPDIADVKRWGNYIFLKGKKAGTTNLILLDRAKQVISIYDLEVAYDVAGLKQQLHTLLPGETEIRAVGSQGSITLLGEVSSTASLSQVLSLAAAYAPKDKIVNQLQVGGIHQVMLEVRVAEMSRRVTKRMGLNFSVVNGNDFGVSLLGGLSSFDSTGESAVQTFSDAITALLRFSSGNTTWTFFIDALKENGMAKILAEPTLIAQSGQTASFLAGGEFPYPVPQGGNNDNITIEFKAFGVMLLFTPTVLSEDRISISVAPEISELDFSTAQRFGGFVVPGLTKRTASTTVELADGQSFAIAGLLKETVKEDISKFPLLGDIPILGALFRSSAFQKDETELIIIVTVHLVKPLDMAKQTLPTDYYIEPNDVEFYILGLMEGRERKKPEELTGELDGEFGHGIRISK